MWYFLSLKNDLLFETFVTCLSKEKVQSSACRWLHIPNDNPEQQSYTCFLEFKGPAGTVDIL